LVKRARSLYKESVPVLSSGDAGEEDSRCNLGTVLEDFEL
jgi:hypothetical protein